VDDILGTQYEQQYRYHRIPEMIRGMKRVAATHFLGLLVIDEFQNLSVAKGGGDEKMLNYFVELVELIGVPLLLIGTYKAIGLLSKTMRNARRATGDGYLEFKRHAPDSVEWRLLVYGIWYYQWVKSPIALPDLKGDPELIREFDEKIVYPLYDLTQGITSVLVIIFMQAQWRALRADEETIDEALLKETYNECLKILHPALNALRSGKLEDLKSFDDLLPPIGDMDALGASPAPLWDGTSIPSKPIASKERTKATKQEEEFADLDQGWVIVPPAAIDEKLDLRRLKGKQSIHALLSTENQITDIHSLVYGMKGSAH
jgi:hypothetical protein